MSKYDKIKETLQSEPKVWLVTGCAGFIGSNLVETLLLLGQRVVGLDNFSTGFRENLDEVCSLVGESNWANFRLIEGDITDLAMCAAAVEGVDYVLHQAALGSVPRSIADPVATNAANITGFVNMLTAAKDENVKSFTYAASSSTYGDHPALPKVEENIGKPLSPYAVTKYVNELYAEVWEKSYGFSAIGLRYFNVFGKRQNPNGAYAAVIPKWVLAMLRGELININGDGETSRDFCFIENVVQMNILAAVAPVNVKNNVFNTAKGDQTSLNQLFGMIRSILRNNGYEYDLEPSYREFRAGDVRHSKADISKAEGLLGYAPLFKLEDGLERAMPWYINGLI